MTDLRNDIRNLIVMDTQYGWRGATELKAEDVDRLQSLGWVAEGEENDEYDITDEGRAVIDRALAAQPAPVGGVPMPIHPFADVSAGAEGWDHAEEAVILAYGDARAAAASQPAPASVGAEAEAMKMLFLDAAEAALNRHVVQGWTDSDGGPYPLIDFLTPEGRPVSEGMGEVRLMVHSILVEIDRRLDGTGSGIRIVESNAITDGDALIVQDGRPVAKITGLAGTGGE